MVREVHLSWDSEQPFPAELERSTWDSEESPLEDITLPSHAQRQPKLKANAKEQRPHERPK